MSELERAKWAPICNEALQLICQRLDEIAKGRKTETREQKAVWLPCLETLAAIVRRHTAERQRSTEEPSQSRFHPLTWLIAKLCLALRTLLTVARRSSRRPFLEESREEKRPEAADPWRFLESVASQVRAAGNDEEADTIMQICTGTVSLEMDGEKVIHAGVQHKGHLVEPEEWQPFFRLIATHLQGAGYEEEADILTEWTAIEVDEVIDDFDYRLDWRPFFDGFWNELEESGHQDLAREIRRLCGFRFDAIADPAYRQERWGKEEVILPQLKSLIEAFMSDTGIQPLPPVTDEGEGNGGDDSTPTAEQGEGKDAPPKKPRATKLATNKKKRGRPVDPLTIQRTEFAEPLREEGKSWPEIARLYSRKYPKDIDATDGTIRLACERPRKNEPK